MYTTVEGLLKQIHDRLHGANPLARGDVASSSQKNKFAAFLDALQEYRSGLEPFTIVMEDPMDQSLIFSTGTAEHVDSQLVQTSYVRTAEENEECGLIDPAYREFDPEYLANLALEGDPVPQPR